MLLFLVPAVVSAAAPMLRSASGAHAAALAAAGANTATSTAATGLAQLVVVAVHGLAVPASPTA